MGLDTEESDFDILNEFVSTSLPEVQSWVNRCSNEQNFHADLEYFDAIEAFVKQVKESGVIVIRDDAGRCIEHEVTNFTHDAIALIVERGHSISKASKLAWTNYATMSDSVALLGKGFKYFIEQDVSEEARELRHASRVVVKMRDEYQAKVDYVKAPDADGLKYVANLAKNNRNALAKVFIDYAGDDVVEEILSTTKPADYKKLSGFTKAILDIVVADFNDKSNKEEGYKPKHNDLMQFFKSYYLSNNGKLKFPNWITMSSENDRAARS